MTLLIRNARVLTMAGPPGPRRGATLGSLGEIERADVLVEDERIATIGTRLPIPEGAEVIEADGRVLMPGFVDCHTHACWAGDRLDEWELKKRGATYLQVLEAGGGIMSTVRAVRAATRESLASTLLERLDAMLAEGTTSVEVKSGYGLSTEDELKMLRAIQDAAALWAGTVVPTACIGHAIDGDHATFVERTINETLPGVSEAFPGITLDAYCEQGAWSLDDCVRLFERGLELGHPFRVHADQFNSLGMLPGAIRLGARSVDHLEASRPDELRALAASDTFGVMLPCCGFHVDGRYADARRFLEADGALAIATNCNPGSAPCWSMPMAIALATRGLGLSVGEAIGASTVNAARLLGLNDRGVIREDARADLVLLRHRDERSLGYDFGGRHALAVVCGGRVVS